MDLKDVKFRLNKTSCCENGFLLLGWHHACLSIIYKNRIKILSEGRIADDIYFWIDKWDKFFGINENVEIVKEYIMDPKNCGSCETYYENTF